MDLPAETPKVEEAETPISRDSSEESLSDLDSEKSPPLPASDPYSDPSLAGWVSAEKH